MPEATPIPVRDYARQLGLRLWSIHAARGLWLAAGCAALALLAAEGLARPVLTRGSAALVWCSAGAAAMLGFAASLWPLRRYRGARIADLVANADRALADRMRSALELGTQAGLGATSPDLVRAHIAQVESALLTLPGKSVVPWTRLVHTTFLLGVLGVLGFIALSVQRPALRAFVGALVSPAHERADGTRVGAVVSGWRVKLSYPSYLGREGVWEREPRKLSVPAGTSLEFEIRPAFGVQRGQLQSGTGSVALSVAADGLLRGRMSARSNQTLRMRLEADGARYEDPRGIELQVTADSSPTISIEEPQSGTLAPPDEPLTLRFVADDDVGVANVSLHARLPDGAEKQRQLFSAIDDGGPQRELRSGTILVPAELGAAEGDTLMVWLEARDADLVSGPHVTKSREVLLEVAQPGPGLSALIPSLQQVADEAVEVLGDRLEHPVEREPQSAKARFGAVERITRAWLARLEAVTKGGAKNQPSAGLDLDQLRGVARRNDHLLKAEAALHANAVHPYPERAQQDGRGVDELERDVLLLADILARAHVDEAKSIAQELRSLKEHIESLLDQLGKTQSKEAERELMREIAKAQRRLAELAQSLSRMATRVPGEFVNREAMKQEAAESSLENLEKAVQDHDLRAAAEHLDALAKQIDELAGQLNEGGLRLQEQRFGPRDQALAQARQKLEMLSNEQNRLAERSGSVTRDAMSRAQGVDARARSLAPQAEALERAASELGRGRSDAWGSAASSRALERLRDARDALRSGDLAQARGMAQSAQRSLQESAAELESEARMFPGHQGETAARADAARRAASEAERLSQAIDRAMPEVASHVSDAERQRLQGDVEAQRKAAATAESLGQNMAKGPDGLPLSPDGVEKLEAARDAMQRAEQALQRGRPDDANREQRKAAEQLQDVAQALTPKNSGSSAGGGQPQGNGGMARSTPVHIPGTEEWKGPTELRRRLLDAMHEGGPSGYEAAIERYYQELLR